MSSRKKCTCPSTPTPLPDSRLIGTCTSRPSCRYRPNQMMPGLIVPVVRPDRGPSTGVCIANSTIGIMRENGRGSPTSRTNDCRYCRLYWSEKPHVTTFGFNSFSTWGCPPPSSSSSGTVMVLLKRRVGRSTPNAPVRAIGLRYARPSGRSPNPLPKKSRGVTVSNDSAPIFLLPVPPTSHDTPADSSVSWAAFLKKTYLSDTSMLSNPDWLLP